MAINDVSLTAGMRTNLISLQNTAELLSRTTERLSTGKKINSPIDGPIAYFTAENHMQRASDLSLLKDGMGEALQTIQQADIGLDTISELIAQAKSIAASAKSDLGNATLVNQYNELLSQMATVAQDSRYFGMNLLQGSVAGTPDSMQVDFNESGTSTLTVDGTDITYTAGATLDIVYNAVTTQVNDATVAIFSDVGLINTAIGELDTALSELRAISQSLSSNMSIIMTRQEFTKTTIDNLTIGADNLTLADMNEESANMLMLQTRQGLGISSLGLATEAAQSILRLFS